MKKIWDKTFTKIHTNKRMLVFLFTLLFMAVLFGSFFATKLGQNDLNEIKTSLESFFTMTKQNQLQPIQAFFQTFGANISFAIAIWILGISVIGAPLMIVLFFMKAFTLGFTIASLIKIYHMKGLLYSFIYVFPHQVINLLVFTFFIMFSMSLSITLFQALIKKKTVDFSKIVNRYLFVLVFTVVILIITALLEIYLMPFLFRMVLS
mgnify:FL=1